jgi:LAS superfamily LD-carboxypeptidase LdcB
MHVIEPVPKRKKKSRRKSAQLSLFAVGGLIIVILGGFMFVTRNNQRVKDILGSNDQTNDTSSTNTKNGYKYFSAYDFQKLYEQTAYPNTQQLQGLPHITGNPGVDTRIRQVAESRGYKLESTPVQAIARVADINDAEDNLLQPSAYEGWLKLKELASKDNIPLRVKTGYRSIERQRILFIDRLNMTGVNASQIADGKVDHALLATIFAVAPPGYSRHHTGYAIDLVCDDKSEKAFEFTPCAAWLKANNYNKSKQAGYIPSLVDKVGPPNSDPNSAEYVWVGTNTFY